MTTVSSFSLTCEGGPLLPVHTRFAPNSGLSRRVDKDGHAPLGRTPSPSKTTCHHKAMPITRLFLQRNKKKKRPHTPESFLFLYARDKGFLRFANRDGR
ncbi:hypothetical protein CEXT_336111 [Caerostris extrusa]|uniref:Uncharacterized protein n=1 Tax=Caerostris extrusa TaxID=172846 RepID=A0AAV4S6Y9_CAEEX|nr:hypothetical protein CEXT_336111 [Caerostris extrusa]